jgi:putative transposase
VDAPLFFGRQLNGWILVESNARDSRRNRACTPVRTVLRIAGDLVRLVAAAAQSHARLAAENLFLRGELALYVERQVKPRRADDATWIALVALSWLIDWRRVLTVVKPDTLVRWHRKGFRLFWRWKSPPRGRPRVPADVRRLIGEMASANRTWGEERIASELLLKLGILLRLRVLEVGTRRIRHRNVTEHPTADLTVQQFRMLISGDGPHRFLTHDHDSIYSDRVDRTVAAMGLTVLRTPVRSPQANAFCERVIGTSAWTG